ncbi:MAG: PAS domain-containing protein [Rubrivivax sp.]|nr:PAS domain-containing protein [Rubrivivax sp.]
MTDAHKPPTARVSTVVLTYAVFAGLWILLSDRAMGVLFVDPALLVQASMVKGWFFVGVTSLLLYVLVRRLTAALEGGHRRELAFERERRQAPPMLVAIAEASDDAIFAKDDQGRYLLFNTAASRYVGKPVEQVLGLDDRALFPPDQAEHLMAIDRRVRETGQAETGEEVLQTATGERVFLATKGPLRGADGVVFGTYGISRDITDRRLADDALRRMAEDLKATLQAIPDLMFELDAQGRYLDFRALDESLLAAPPDQLPGRSVGDLLPPDAAAVVMASLAAAGRSGTDFGRTMMLPLPTGARHFELSVARRPVVPGQGERFVVLSRDITARKAAEEELWQRNEELERFNRAATEREQRMVALKREVNEMALVAGRPPPYDLAFAETNGAHG